MELLEEPPKKWKAGTLHGDKFDVERNLWFPARRLVPLHVLKDKLDVYIAEGHIAAPEKDHYAQVFEEMLGVHRENNLHGATTGDGASATIAEPDEENRPTIESELRHELETRKRQMQSIQGGESTKKPSNV